MGSILICAAFATSMHSLMMRWAMRRLFLLSETSPNVQPSAAESPLNALLISSLDQRAPKKFFSISTVPIVRSSSIA